MNTKQEKFIPPKASRATSHTNPKCQRGKDLTPLPALRDGVTDDRRKYRAKRRLSAFVWAGIALGCLAFCNRGLLAEPGSARPRTKESAGGRVVPNSSASTDNRKASRGPRAATFVEDSAVEEAGGQPAEPSGIPGFQPENLVSPGGLSSTLNLMIVLTVLSLAPSILIMTTCFIRFIIVTSLLRQALGTQQLPPNQVLVALCLFMTFMVMSPVWQRSYDEGIKLYTNPQPDQPQPTLAETFKNTAAPIRAFMYDQINNAKNTDTIWMFLDYQFPTELNKTGDSETDPDRVLPTTDAEIPLPTLISSFILSELKVAFIIGFQIFLPFMVIDMVVSTVLMSMGMMMLPPTLVSFPFKLLLFVLIDGWTLTVGMLLDSVRLSGSG
jgi:flagellar biosynthetic protein FliP